MKGWCWFLWLCCLASGTNLLAQAAELPTQAGPYQALALADPSPANLYNAGVAWEKAQEPVRALQFYRKARALGLPEAATAQARVEASLQLPPRETGVLPAYILWLAALALAVLASLLGMGHLLRPRPALPRLAWGLAGCSGLLGGMLLLQGGLLAPGPLVVAAQELRSGPGWAFPVSSQVPAGAEVQQQGQHSGWVRVSYQDQAGWLPQAALLP